LLIVDDGSTDASPQIAADAASADGRIRLLRSTRRGAANARNEGIRAATGEFVAFLDADDLYEDEKLAFEVDILRRHPAAVMTCGPTHWWYDGAPGRSWTESVQGFANRLHAPPDLLRRIILDQQGDVPCICAALIRREPVQATGGFFEGFSLYEDQTLWVKLMLHHPVYVHDKALCCYRQHPASASADATRAGEYDWSRPHPARLAFLTWVAGYARESRPDPKLLRSLRLALAPYPEARVSITPADRAALAGRKLRRMGVRLLRTVQRRIKRARR